MRTDAPPPGPAPPAPLGALVVGGGAVGTWLACALAGGGATVTLAEPDAGRRSQLEAGLAVVEGRRSSRVRVALATSIAEALARSRPEVGLVAVKSYRTERVAAELAAAPPPRLASLQNGVDNDTALSVALGASRVVAATLTTGLSIAADGVVHAVPGGGIGLAAVEGDAIVDRLASALGRGGLAVRRYAEGASMKWSKLLLNLLGSATCALLDGPPREAFGHRALFCLERQAWLEALAVMRALGLSPLPLPGYPVPLLVAVMTRLPGPAAHRLLAGRLSAGRGDRLPSVAADIAAGRRETENGALTGAVARHAAAVGVAAPVSTALAAMVEDLVAGRLDRRAFANRPDRLVAEVRARTAPERSR